jgi:hypothetical protein
MPGDCNFIALGLLQYRAMGDVNIAPFFSFGSEAAGGAQNQSHCCGNNEGTAVMRGHKEHRTSLSLFFLEAQKYP